MKKQSGFTLIELMIVVAIVAILAAIALPAYQDYTAKAKATAALRMADSVKTAVALCYQTTSSLDNCNAGSAGIPTIADKDLGVSGTSAGLLNVAKGVITLTTQLGSKWGTVTLNPEVAETKLTWKITASEDCAKYIDNCTKP